MYPLKFDKVFKEKIWGGRRFEEVLGMNLPSEEKYGESWEVTSHKNGMSIVNNGEFVGKSLEELLIIYKDKLVGEEIYNKFANKFPLLIKYLDINDKLSLQVHPNDEYALRVEREFGKAESWYIIDASSDAKLIMGLNPSINKEQFSEKVKINDFDNLFNIIPVKKGDFINVNPGLVHTSFEGAVLVCEIQQNSDTTYRIYDFDRIVDGKLRELHIEKALEVIDYKQVPEISKNSTRENFVKDGAQIQTLVKGHYYNVDKINIIGSHKENSYKNFIIYSILEGSGSIIHNFCEYPVKKGDSYFIPQGLELDIIGNLEMLKTYI